MTENLKNGFAPIEDKCVVLIGTNDFLKVSNFNLIMTINIFNKLMVIMKLLLTGL